jgi:maltooligosyltrehalose trehalohydrolase
MKYGFLYQGQRYKWQKQRRGTPAFGLPPEAFVTFIENHDQVANSARGERVHRLTSPGRLKAITMLILLGPGTPMLFQGQEFGSSAPFLFFADHEAKLAEQVAAGRREFLGQWRGLRLAEMQGCFSLPHDPQTFERCKLDWSERERNQPTLEFHRELLRVSGALAAGASRGGRCRAVVSRAGASILRRRAR